MALLLTVQESAGTLGAWPVVRKLPVTLWAWPVVRKLPVTLWAWPAARELPVTLGAWFVVRELLVAVGASREACQLVYSCAPGPAVDFLPDPVPGRPLE